MKIVSFFSTGDYNLVPLPLSFSLSSFFLARERKETKPWEQIEVANGFLFQSIGAINNIDCMYIM